MQNPAFIDTLIRSDFFRQYEMAFTELTGLPMALRPVGSKVLPFHGKARENHFCALMASKRATCAACIMAQETLQKEALRGPAIFSCRHGLSEIAVPVQTSGETIAFLRTGQVLASEPGPRQLQELVVELEALGIKSPKKGLIEAYKRTPVINGQRLKAVVHLLKTFAELLSERANRIAVMDAHNEPYIVTRAKQYVRLHPADQLSLHAVAEAVNASTFHLCKVFRAATGLHFTEYISRVRVEKARELLLNDNLRIGDVAYQSGFQSLTHFNRMFRRITGASPTDYREQLHRWRKNMRDVE